MSQETEANGAAGWRRRHPVLSRGLLYGAAVLLIALAVGLLLRRREVNRQDRLDQLEARLDTLDVLSVMDPEGDELLKVLDEEFSDPDLPPHIRQRVLRARAFQHLRRDEGEEAFAALDAAASLATDPQDRDVIRLERVQALVLDGRPAEAEAALDGLDTPAHPALVIWRGLLRAQALHGQARPEDAARALDDTLEALRRPLPPAPAVVFAQTPWTPAEAAIQATQALVAFSPRPLGPGPWQRLLGLAPRDLVAALEAAKALWRGGHREEAGRAWDWAVSLNAGRAPENAASDPDLRALERFREGGLKTDGASGR